MQTVLIVFHLMIVVALVATVLLQRSEGGALGMGGGGGFMTGRGQANALTRATAILATLFFITSLALSIIASYSRAPKSIFENAPHATTGAPATSSAPVAGETPLDTLRRLENQRSGGGASGAAPATTTVPTTTAPAASAPAAPAEPEAPKSQ